MPEFPNIPKVQVSRTDGGLRVNTTDANPLVLLLGTASKGPGDEPFEAQDLAAARQVFGQTSELYQALVEARKGYGEAANIWLYRIGTDPAILQIGAAATSPEVVKVVVRDRKSDIGTTYKASYNATSGLLWVYNENGTLVYSNSANNDVDLGEVEIRGDLTLVSGENSFGDPSNGTLASSVTLSGSQASGTTFTAAVTGPATGNAKGRYEALQDAYRLLETFDCDIVVPINAWTDEYNVAYFVSGTNAWTDKNNPAVWGSGVLGWFKETAPTVSSIDGKYTYQWADDYALTLPVASGYHNWADSDERIAATFREVSFAYQLANFCYQQTKNQSTCIGVIGFRAPASYSLGDIQAWIGKAPTLNQQGSITTDGYGLLGFADVNGVTAGKLNPLCHDKSTGRTAGYFATSAEFRDDSALTDAGDNSIDIGAYVNWAAEWPIHLNSTAGVTGQSNTLANYYAGMIGRLDEKNAPTNELAPGLRIPYDAGKAKWDDLVAAHLVVMQQRTEGAFVIDAPTAAREASDYRRLTTVRLVGLTEDVIRRVGWKYIGKASNAIKKAAFENDIEEELQKLVKRGYLKRFEFNVTTNLLQDILGQAHVTLLLVVPNELRQIFATIALGVE